MKFNPVPLIAVLLLYSYAGSAQVVPSQREDENRGVTSGNFLIGQLGPLKRELARQILSTDSFHLFDRLARTDSWQCRPLNESCRIDVIMADRIRTIDPLNIH